MPMQSRWPPMDYAALAAMMAALAYPVRLEMLQALRTPHTLRDLRVIPMRGEGGGSTTSAARQTVTRHLRKLIDARLVRVDRTGEGQRYVLDSQRLWAFTQEVLRLAVLHAGAPGGHNATGTVQGPHHTRHDAVQGPHVVLVHGVREGRRYPLDGEGPWSVGRRPGAHVPLDYDPFASLDHAVLAHDDQWTIEDAGSKNGTGVNWLMAAPHEPVPLQAGDILIVGRSLLCFRDR